MYYQILKSFHPTGFLDGLVNSKLSARFSLDLLPGFELLAGKCVSYDTNATAGTVSDYIRHPTIWYFFAEDNFTDSMLDLSRV